MLPSHETVPELVYAVSHDIGEPIREILGFAQLMAQRAPEHVDAQFWDDLGHIESGAVRAREMLAALVEYVRTDDLEPVVAETDLRTVCTDVLATTAPMRALFPNVVGLDVDLTVATYPRVVHDVLAELITNAVRFGASPEDDVAHITVRACPDDDRIVLSVEDRGPGLTDDERTRAVRLFQRLYRRTDHDTLGAGLAIARRRVERCGGALTLDVGTSGRGLRVEVDLPIPIIDLRADVAAADLPLAT